MKVTQDRKHTQSSEKFDCMSLINDLQEKHGTIFWDTIDNTVFIYRALGRKEYRELIKANISKIEEEDVLCEACVLYPEDYDFSECPAGIPTQLAELILKNSYLDSFESKKLAINYYRQEMSNFDNQISCIISEAFPNLDIEEIDKWDMGKTAQYLAKAEWKLNILRGVPVDYEMSDKLMEADWNLQHMKNSDIPVEEVNQETKEVVEKPMATKPRLRNETLEERQKRLASEPVRKKTKEELAELKRRFPEIDWGAEVDPSKDIDAMRDVVDTISPALRVGW